MRTYSHIWSVLVLPLLLLPLLVSAQLSGCPTRCLCFYRDNGMVVRCMFVGLTEIPAVPRDTTILDLRFNRISSITPGVFDGLGSLYTLLLNSNELEEVTGGAFMGLDNLKFLYLYKNKIERVDGSAFRGLTQLEQLYMHSNMIAQIPTPAFNDLHSLQRLFLHNNKIRSLEEEALSPLTSLTRLRLDSNPLLCDCNLKWLKSYISSAEHLMEIAATCSDPSELSGTPINEVEDFGCEVADQPQISNSIPYPTSRVFNNIQPASPSNEPDVSGIRPRIITQPRDVEVEVGERAYMRCQAAGNPRPQITWYHNQREIISNGVDNSLTDNRYRVLSDGTLIIDETTLADQGTYSCMARSSAGQVISNLANLRVETNSILVERPEFILTPRDQVATEGSSFSLSCTASGPARVQWYKDSQPYSLDPSRSTLLASGTMLITQVTREDAGTYTCSATLGRETVHSTASILVRVEPYFTLAPESVSVVEGGIAYFTCEVAGYPEPVINWSKDGDDLGDDARFTTTDNNTNLRISNVRLSDSGRYECEASNALNTVSSYALLTVRTQDAPEFDISLSAYGTMTVELGSDAAFGCAATGDPAPTIQWRRYGEVINPAADEEQKYDVSGEGTLTVYNISLEDAGSYECHAVNPAGSRVLTILAQVVGEVEKVYPGDRFVEEAVQTARNEVESAANHTLRDLNDKTKPVSSSDLLALFKFPSQAAQSIARSAEIFERTLELISQKVHDSPHVKLDGTSSAADVYQNVQEILSPPQIRLVAELSGCAEARPPIDCTNMCFHMKYRSIDGSCNNLRRPIVGSSLTKFNRWLPAEYENNFNLPIGWNTTRLYHGFTKPSARLVSTNILSSHEIEQDDKYTSFVMQWGQFLDHDITLTPMSVSRSRFSDGMQCNSTCENQAPCFPIQTPPGDSRLGSRRCIGVTRSSAVCGSGMTSVFFNKITHREQINELTAFIDASNVYGSDEEFARSLRDLARGRGLLRTGLLQTTSGKHLLPFNIDAPMDCQIEPSKTHIPCFLAGDLRANEQLGLLSMHTLFLREHNRIARQLAELNPHWDGDMVYYETRKIIGALMQHITYKHWLPKVIGPVGMSILDDYKGYDPSIDPSILNVFATAAFRFGHTLINPILYRYNSTMEEHEFGHLALHKAFFAPYRLIEEGGIDPIIRGLYGSPAKQSSPHSVFNSELTEKLFKLAHAIALDLAALNVQRGRDHALPSYNQWRKKCGLNKAQTFDELANEIPDLKIRMKLEKVYGHPGNIDLFVGGVLEKFLPGARVGPTFMCVIAEQFKRLRDGDRFYYENPGVFTTDQLSEIKQVTLSHIICMSSDNITRVPKDAFTVSQYPKQYLSCGSSSIPELNLKVWSQCCHDCNEAGDFQSITHSVLSRNKRSTLDNSFSYKEDKPEIPPKQPRGRAGDMSQVTEDRIEGLEETIDVLSEQIQILKQKLDDIVTSHATAGGNEVGDGSCLYGDRTYKNGDTWTPEKGDYSAYCTCKGGIVTCGMT